ncbi:MAG: peptide chain release factor 2 [Clostridia bacterium]
MIDFINQKNKLAELEKTLDTSIVAMKFDDIKKRIAELTEIQHADGYWENIAEAQKYNKELKLLNGKCDHVSKLKKELEEVNLLIELSEEGEDESEVDEINKQISALSSKIDILRLETLFKGKYDNLNAILTLHAGAGGTEAQDWVSMLYRMYTRYLERNDYGIEVLDLLEGEEAGIKSVTFMATGDNAYGYLKAEKGIHRLVRISPFDSNSRRHTSFASLEVMPEIENDDEIVINPDDLKVNTYRSSGAGGQHVNKTESAIRITHIPSGIVVACQNERSQIQNRETAMKMLRSMLIEKREREQLENANSIKGDLKKIEWGSQIRSYVFCPYTLVKDHRTGFETGNVQAVMDGYIDDFIIEYLKRS